MCAVLQRRLPARVVTGWTEQDHRRVGPGHAQPREQFQWVNAGKRLVHDDGGEGAAAQPNQHLGGVRRLDDLAPAVP
jgi:hypothetical protein